MHPNFQRGHKDSLDKVRKKKVQRRESFIGYQEIPSIKPTHLLPAYYDFSADPLMLNSSSFSDDVKASFKSIEKYPVPLSPKPLYMQDSESLLPYSTDTYLPESTNRPSKRLYCDLRNFEKVYSVDQLKQLSSFDHKYEDLGLSFLGQSTKANLSSHGCDIYSSLNNLLSLNQLFPTSYSSSIRSQYQLDSAIENCHHNRYEPPFSPLQFSNSTATHLSTVLHSKVVNETKRSFMIDDKCEVTLNKAAKKLVTATSDGKPVITSSSDEEETFTEHKTKSHRVNQTYPWYENPIISDYLSAFPRTYSEM
jgi:hypothetical protein